ncbi:MAG TPA: YdeI/OmpD-associated family protein [Longimicrobium sp.]|nr:YdeI/OmpD-associated family protein [Longimicrobium sp.]
MEPVHFASAADFRAWLERHHGDTPELMVGIWKKDSGNGGITYSEALDEALCFGWIDGVRRKVDAERYAQRFTPRRARSAWSEVNIRRATELSEQGRMHPAGAAAFAARDPEKTREISHEARFRPLDEAFERDFRADVAAWTFFQAQAPFYRRNAAGWVMGAKKEETRRRRLDELIAACARGERMPKLVGAAK